MQGKGRAAAATFCLLLLLVGNALAAQTEITAEYLGLHPMRGNEACKNRLVMSLCHTLWAQQDSDIPQYCNRYRNSNEFEITTYSRDELTPEILQKFRTVTAEALNQFCGKSVCIDDARNVTDVQVLPENVVLLPNIWTNDAGNPVLAYYVLISENTYLSEETLQLAIESADDLHEEAGFLDKLPSLRLWFINDSPIVKGRDVTAYIETSNPVAKMICQMSGQPDVNCSSGVVQYTNLETYDVDKMYTLRVKATALDGKVYQIQRKLRIEKPGYCTAHLINNGVTVHDGKVRIEFAPTGYTVSTTCILDPPKTKDNKFFECSSPLVMEVSPGRHKFKVTPQGCYHYKFPIKFQFEVPEKKDLCDI